MKSFRVGILGQGRSGYGIHASRLLKDTDRFTIAAVADLLPERTRDCAEAVGAKAYGDYKDLLADRGLGLDLVVNALPSFLHPQGTLDALNAGVHVVCEKPAARSVADFDAMVQAADANGKLLLPFQNSRFQPAFKKIRSVIDSGRLGRVIHARISFSNFARRWDWQTRREFWGGNLLNTGPHPVDQAVVLFGDAMPNVFARLVSDNPFGDAENFASVTLWGENAPTIEVVVSSFMAYPQGDMYNIQGAFGGLSGSLAELKWKYFDPATAPVQKTRGTWSDDRRFCREQLDWTEETWKLSDDPDNMGTIAQSFYDDAYGILAHGAPRVIQLDEVRRQVAVMEEAHRQNPNLR